MTRAQCQALSVQAQRDVYDLVLEGVVVHPVKEPSRLRISKTRRIEVFWRQR
ncbi:MAG: hypothetical protein M5U22_14160 [Thermoleophilia bacterium]|nr:hypothetical protein [Thermoleophilia bacterium]